MTAVISPPEGGSTTLTAREPLVYSEHSPHSFFADMMRRETHDGAADRLRRHEAQMRVETARRERSDALRFGEHLAAHDAEVRVNPNSTTGTGGEFTPPLWLIDKYASASRAGRPFADLLNPIVLPSGVQSIHIPRMTTGFLTGAQTDGSATPSGDIVTVDANSTVVTIAGQADVSQQLFDLTPIGFDAVAYTDLNRDYNRKLEAQLLTGTGSNGTVLGVSNVSNITSVSGTGATTIATIWPLFGQVCAQVSNNRLLRPEIWLMAGRRWFWIASSIDSSNRPIASPHSEAHSTDLPKAGGEFPIGSVLGVPVWTDGAIPAGTSADTAYALRPSDMFLWESTPKFITAPNPDSGTLQMRLSMHRYVAFVPQRYPAGIGLLTGLPQPTNF